MNFKFLQYITLGVEGYNAVTTVAAMVRAPQLLSADAVWGVIQPVLCEIEQIANIKINLALAQQIATDAVNTIKAALTKGA